ncbi:MAG: acyltransferase family protein [Bulleidia sp.]
MYPQSCPRPLFFSGFQTLFYSDVFGTMDGYSAIWLMILYLVGGYIGKYHSQSDKNLLLFFLGYVLMVVLTWLSKVVIELLTLQVLGEVRAGNYLISYKSPTILMSAVFLLLCFSNLKLSDRMKKLVSFVAPMSFSVYLIHNHPLVATVVMNRMFASYAELPVVEMVVKVLLTALFIYSVCSVIDWFRLYVFRTIGIRERMDKIEGKLKSKLIQRSQIIHKDSPNIQS